MLCRWNVRLLSLRGQVEVVGGVSTGMFQVGFGSVGVYDKTYERSILEVNGRIVLEGKAKFGHGSRISVGPDAELVIGPDFSNTAMCTIICWHRIHFGRNVLSSWQVLVMDTDFHPVVETATGRVGTYTKAVNIDDDVWLGTRSVVLKGSHLAQGCIVGAGAVVSGRFDEPCCVVAGNPAAVRKHGVMRLYE